MRIALFALVALLAGALQAAALDPDTDLSAVSASFIGEDSLDYAGWSISPAGDLNGDGFDDILIGADLGDQAGIRGGETYVIFGSTSGWAMDTNIATAASASFLGETSLDGAGRSVAGVGDVNGDGFDDLLIGANRRASEAGETYLVFGKASGWAMDTSLADADASFLGELAGDWSAIWVAAAGNVNGDGFDDFLIGAYLNDEAGGNTGQTYLILGKASGWAMDTSLASADASFRGETPGDGSGKAVASAGDVDGDGFDDILIGATGSTSSRGETYLILGKAVGWAMDTSLSASDASFVGEFPLDASGRSVASAGDVNGDGFDDILIGADENDEAGDRAGQAYLVLGKQTGWSMNTQLAAADASFLAESPGDHAGVSVASAGDVSGDGLDDILIGATWRGQYTGKAYLILGKQTGWSLDTDLASADASFIGEGTYNYAGFAVASAGDLNGDGGTDFLISAPYKLAGETYLVFGTAAATAIPLLDAWGAVAVALILATATALRRAR